MDQTTRWLGAAAPALLFMTAGVGAGDEAPSFGFSNRTVEAGVAMVHDVTDQNGVSYTGGATVGDFNNDGWQDLYVLGGGGAPAAIPPGIGSGPAGRDRLYINNGDGTFTDETASWMPTMPHRGRGLAVGDYDGNGWLDLFVTSTGPMHETSGPARHMLYRNNGDGTFTEVAQAAGVKTTSTTLPTGMSACFGDYDLDGDLDLFVGGHHGLLGNNEGNRLFRNDGDGTFTDVTVATGLFDGTGNVASLATMFVDMDGDRYPELLIAGDFGNQVAWAGSRYFRNDGGATFTDVTDASGTGLDENGMGHAVGDFDNDGRLDWYVTSIYQPAISWTGNKLYMANGDHQFQETSAAAGVVDGGFGWGTVAVDFDHDGLLDIAETNGDGVGAGLYFQEQSYLWMNDGDGTFAEQALTRGLVHHDEGRSLLNLDYDNDGDQDLVISAYAGPLALFRNDLSGPGTNWLRVFLDTTGVDDLAPNGFGARVVATAGGTTRTRVVHGGSGFLGVAELSAHFGLGAETVVTELRVAWPNGDESVFTDVPVNRTVTIRADGPCLDDGSDPTDCDGNGRPDVCDLALDPGADGNGNGTLDACEPNPDVNGDGNVNLFDLVVILLNFGPCPAPPTCLGDATRDGTVDIDDIVSVVLHWGR